MQLRLSRLQTQLHRHAPERKGIKHDAPIDIGSDSNEEGPAPLQKPAEARVHVEYAPDKVRRIFHEAELCLARDAQQGMDDLHGR